jgi:hypothetical protein
MAFGRAPFAFYVAHLYLIHAIAIALGVVQGFEAYQFLTAGRLVPLSVLPMGDRCQSAPSRLVAELRVGLDVSSQSASHGWPSTSRSAC